MNQPAPPIPVCKAFLVCRAVTQDPQFKDLAIVGLTKGYIYQRFPCARQLSFFARWASAHGSYLAEVQLQTPEGEIVWQDGPSELWNMSDPLIDFDLTLELCPIFPKPDTYDFVLTANGQEIARQKFPAHLAEHPGRSHGEQREPR